MSKTARCPQCAQPARLDAGNPWRPFCSERCKLLDLGAWTSERYTISTDDDIALGDPAAQNESKPQ